MDNPKPNPEVTNRAREALSAYRTALINSDDEISTPVAFALEKLFRVALPDLVETVDAIYAGYLEYDAALKRREHAGVAASRLVDVVTEQLGVDRG